MNSPIIIKPGGRCSIPDCCVFVDVEPSVREVRAYGKHRVHEFGVGAATCCHLTDGHITDKASLIFRRASTFWAWLGEVRDHHKSTWVFAHNLGYDLTLLGFWDLLSASSDAVTCCVLEDPPTIISIRRGRKLIRFVDVLNYWRLSVSAMATGCCSSAAPKLADTEPQSPDSCRCQQHVEVIETCILRLIATVREMSLCSFRPTAASLAWGAYTKCFLPMSLHPHCNEHARRLERAAYFGGRVEAHCIGLISEPVSVLDCNSLYPSVMATRHYPTALYSYTRMLSTGDLRRAMEDFDVIAHVDLYGSHRPFPSATDNGICYCTDSGSYFMAGPELAAAYQDACVRRVHAAALYHRADIFTSFVDHFYRLKLAAYRTANKALLMLWKLFLNSLYGKFAQKGRCWTHDPQIISPGKFRYWWHRMPGESAPIRCRSINGRVERRAPGVEPRNAMPAIAALVTSAGRCVLEGYLRLAGPQNALYCDTDSVHTLLPGRERLAACGAINAEQLGLLREVIRGDSAYYWGHQHYRVGEHTVCSAIKPTAVQVADGVYLQDAMAGVETVLQSQTLDRVSVSDRVVDTNPRVRHVHRQTNTA